MTRLTITLGTFDHPHQGHVFLLQQCRKIAGQHGIVHVAVNPDEFVQQFKGVTPTMDIEERMTIIGEFSSVDHVSPNIGWEDGGMTVDHIIRETHKNWPTTERLTLENVFLVIGTDWAPPKDYYGQLGITQEWLNKRNITMLYVPRIGDHSSTNIRERVRNG